MWQQVFQKAVADHQIDGALIRANAQRLMHNKFQFNRQFDMEPTSQIYQMPTITWQTAPNGDPEWLYMLKRQEYLYDLLDAYYLTDKREYLQKCRLLIFDWIEHNLSDSTTWRTLDTGIRLLNWTGIVAALSKAQVIDEHDQREIENAVNIQAKYLKQHYLEKYQTSNWGILITSGILVWNAYYPQVIDSEVVTWAQTTYLTELTLQVANDGSNWEQSPLYFIEIWRASLAVMAAYQSQQLQLPAEIRSKVLAMHHYAPHFIRPNGASLLQGDSDRMRIDDLYALSAGFCQQPWVEDTIFKYRLDPVILELAQQLPQVKMTKGPMATKYDSYISGNFFYRSNWTPKADYYHVYNGNLGSGHGHAALGHIDLTLGGQDILVDSGRYTYVDSTERRFLKSAAAHNVIVIDGKPFSLPRDSWKYEFVSTPVANHCRHDDRFEVVSMVYCDQNRPVPVTVNRWLIWDRQLRVFVIFDGLLTTGQHHVSRYWHLSPELTVKKTATNQQQLLLAGKPIAQMAFSEQSVNKSQSLYSERYNQRQTAPYLMTESEFDGNTVLTTVITDNLQIKIRPTSIQQSGQSEQSVTAAHATGITVTDSQHEQQVSYLRQLLNTFVGNKMYYAEGQPFYGNLCVMTKQPQNCKFQRLW